VITCDNGTEFASNRVDAWAHARAIAIYFITLCKPISFRNRGFSLKTLEISRRPIAFKKTLQEKKGEVYFGR